MSSHSASEIIGDWNNLKGTHYHLVFALWLIVRRQASSVEFYQGNDLLAHSTIDDEKTVNPPLSANSNSESSSLAKFHSDAEPVDLWIQLKATKSKWTRSKLLEENLLLNFIYNAAQSNKRGRKWRARLVSQGAVDKDEILEFIAAPDKFPQLNKTFNQIIDEAHKEINENAQTPIVSRAEIVKIALTILEQIAGEEPVPLEVLQSQIESELTLAFPARETVNQIGNFLIGAMIKDSAAGPKTARVYNAEWINKTAQRPVIRRDLLDENVGSACNAAVQRIAALVGYEPDRVVSRESFGESFSRYLASNRACYVLLGTNGAGKSWASADAAVSHLKDKARLLIRGIDFNSEKRLEDLVANELKRYSSSNWSNAQYLQKFVAFPREENHPSFVIILDDLTPTGNIESYCQNLARLVLDCNDAGAKLVITCQQHIWNFLKLAKDIERSDIFAPALGGGDSSHRLSPEVGVSTATNEPDDEIGALSIGKDGSKNYSFILSDFSPEEMEKAVRRRLPEPSATIVFNQLRLPAFLALRKPFFFDRYFEQNESRLLKPKEVPSAYVDQLLDWDEKHAIEKAAAELELSESDLAPALKLLTEALWINRPYGLGYSEALDILRSAIAEKASDLIKVWRKTGFLTIEGNINFAQPLVADWIFAKFAERKSNETNFDFLNELDPGKDFGTVVAYLRQSGEPTVPAEKLIKISAEWTSAVVAGLAQSASEDWRVLAMLSALLAKYQYSELSPEIYNALGQLAARSERAYKWVAEMYLGDRARTWERGALALISTLEYDPRRVEKAIRARLSRVVKINRDFFEKDKRRKWILVNALDPFRSVNHLSAARAGRRIINRYQSLLGSDEVENNRSRDWYFVDDVDEIRGQIALFDADELAHLFSDLLYDNPVLRYRAAQALIKLAIAKPEIAKDALCQRIEQENDGAVFKRLLVAAYHLIEEFSDELLAALCRSAASNFAEGFRSTDGLMFELLGNLAAKNPREVSNLLPTNLEPREPDLQALLGEIFVYALWRLSESSTDGTVDRARFEFFDRLDVSAVTEEIRPFAVRSRAVSLLARMCLDLKIKADELTGRQRFYPNLDKEFLFIDFGDFFEKHLAELSAHESFEQFKLLLLECVRQSDPVNIYPLSPLKNAVFRCGGECLELLTEIAAAMHDPVPLLDALPHGWQAIRVLTSLLKRGKSDAPVIDFARQVLREQHPASTIQADAESRELLAQLGLLEDSPEQSLREQRDAANRLSIFSDSSNAHGIATFTAQNPNKFLEYLDAGILTVDDILTLYALVDQARNWQAVLIARVYGRMVSERPVSLREGRDLCEQMLIAVCSMSPSPVKDQYENIYQTILTLLNDEIPQAVSVPSLPDDKNIIAKSHRSSAEILRRITDTPANQRTGEWLDELLYDRRWWEESDRFTFRDSLLIQGHGQYGIYFFPAVRLALLAASLSTTTRATDPASRIMGERRKTRETLRKREDLLDRNDLRNYDEEMLRYAFEDFDEAARNAPRDERVENMRGAVLLRLGKLSDAETALKKSLALPTSAGRFRAGTLYDLACVYARQDRPDDCRQVLSESAALRPLDKEWVTQDTDLDSVRNEEWFQELLAENEK